MTCRSTVVTTAALAALGSLVVHQVAYLLAYPVQATRAANLADHGHLTTQWALIVPVAAVAATWFILQQARGLGLGHNLRAGPLTAVVAGLFTIQETAETIIAGEAAWAVLANPAVILGLALTPLVALAFARMLAVVADLAQRCARRFRPVLPRPRLRTVPTSDRAPRTPFLLGTPSRGPPALV